MKNYSTRDQIRDYWSVRAATYDSSHGHGQIEEAERQAWLSLIAQKLGPGDGRKALDLATGTGTMATMMHSSGFAVTGLDFAEPMLALARSKAARLGMDIPFLLRDVEQTHEPDAKYDVLIARNLVWTLVDPAATFSEWLRILKPGGTLLIIDADHVSVTWADRLRKLWSRWFHVRPDGHSMLTADQRAAHGAIVADIHFSRGARAEAVTGLLVEAGFVDVSADEGMNALRRAQSAGRGWIAWLQARIRHRFAICAKAPTAT